MQFTGGKPPKKPLHEYPDLVMGTELYSHVGVDSMRRHGLHVLDENTAITASGNAVMFLDITTGALECMLGPPEGGIGAVNIHPSRTMFVVCEKRPEKPLVKLYDYPSRRIRNTLKNGAVLGFSACAFTDSGNLLATVAIEPDFVITIWNWKSEAVVLRSKAFGADVYSVAFSRFDEGKLVTSGMGHIKFWEMATTFTGLKLQGAVGKFGKVEISDVCDATMLPDGKVVSGSEQGSLLLWEGNLIKCELVRKVVPVATEEPVEEGDAPAQKEEQPASAPTYVSCHVGPIEVLRMVENNRIILSAGHDGYLRYWSVDEIDAAENDGVDIQCPITLLKEYFIGEGVQVKSMSPTIDNQFWVIMDASGAIRKAPCWSYDMITSTMVMPPQELPPILTFNAGQIDCGAPSPVDHTAVTGGGDGTIRLIDYIRGKEFYRVQTNSAVTHVRFLDPKIDKTGSLIISAFADGSIRIFQKAANTFKLLSQNRPQKERIIDFAVDSKCTQLYTISEDGTAFYFTLSENATKLEPVGYCELPGTARCCEWNDEGTLCMIGMRGGNIIGLEPPDPSTIDHQEGYKFQAVYHGVGYRQKMKPPVKEKKPGTEEDESSDEEDLDEELDVGPWDVNFIRRLPSKLFAVGMQGNELCYEYSLTTLYKNAVGPPPLPPSGLEPAGRVEEPQRNIAFRNYTCLNAFESYSQKRICIICEKGKILLREYQDLLKCTHATQLHDGIHGHVSCAMMSFDDKLLVTVGHDGMLFASSITGIEPPGVGEAPTLKEFESAPIQPVPAIERCIQEQKEYEDQCRAEEAAEGKRQQCLRKVRYVHEDYETLATENAEQIGGKHVSDEDMVLDPELMEMMKLELQRRVDEAAVDYSWTSAKKEILLNKMKASFVDCFEYDHFAVTAFQKSISVSSLRTVRFTPEQQKRIDEVRARMAMAAENDIDEQEEEEEEEEEDVDPVRKSPLDKTPKLDRKSPQTAQQGSAFRDPESDTSPTKKGDTSKHSAVNTQLEKADERRRERIAQRKGYQALLSRKPKASDEDPALVSEIAHAQKFMGDYVLKTDPNYIIPEHARPTADRKSTQLVTVEDSINILRRAFNERLLGMRDRKAKLCAQLNHDRQRIKECTAQLKAEQDFTPYSLAKIEQPEKRFEIDREGLSQFEKEQERARKRQEQLEKAKKGFGADLAAAEEETKDDAEKIVQKRQSMRTQRKGSMRHQSITMKQKVEMEMKFRIDNIKLTELEDEEATIRREKLQFEKARLERRIARHIQEFDDELEALFNERMRLDADLTMADMRVLLLFREFQLLNEFGKKDSQLSKKLDEKKKEKAEIVDRSRQCSRRCNEKFEQIESLKKKADDLEQELEAVMVNVPEQAKKPLERIYIRRARKTEGDDDDDDDISSSDDDEDEDDDDMFAEGEEEECPQHCDLETFKSILTLRERRWEQEKALHEFKKSGDALNKEYTQLKTKEDGINNQLKAIEKEVHQFQHEKQQQLNLLETIVVLKLSQIRCLTNNDKLPAEFTDDIIVFTTAGLNSLRELIVDIARQKSGKRQDSENLIKEKQKLLRRKTRRQTEYNEWEQKVYEVQLLKFGQRVDLEMLENIAVDRETEELKAQLKREEVKWEKELMKQNEKLLVARSQQQQRISENTTLLKDLGSMRTEQRDLEESLKQSTQKIVAKMSGGSKVATAADRAHLKDLILAQQQEIDALKNEIAMLRRKGGHVYTPVINKVATGTE